MRTEVHSRENSAMFLGIEDGFRSVDRRDRRLSLAAPLSFKQRGCVTEAFEALRGVVGSQSRPRRMRRLKWNGYRKTGFSF